MKFRMSIMVLAILGGLACAGVASAQSRNPKFNAKRVSMTTTSVRPTAAPRSAIQPAGYVLGGHAHSAGCGCETIPSCGCDAAPSCGCDAAPSCGCDVTPSCGCDVAPSSGCDVPCGVACGGSAYCGGRSCCPPLIPALMHGIGSVLDALIPCHGGCGYSCPVYPVGPCNSHPRRVGLLAKLGSHGNCNSCGGCYNEPSCGCGNGSVYGSPISGGTVIESQLEPLTNPFKDDAEMLATPAPSRFIEDTSAAESELEVPVPPAQPVRSSTLRAVPVNPLRPASR